MRNVILLMHVSLDGFAAGPNGEMDWIQVDEQMFEDVAQVTATADMALFGRVTYAMMADYWPTAADQPNASKHDIEHGKWVNQATKLVFSKTLASAEWQNSHIVRDNIAEEIAQRKAQPGKNLLMIGSIRTAHTFMQLGLIDEYWLNVNPVILGGGLPLFTNLDARAQLKLLDTKIYPSGVIGLHYIKTTQEN